MIIDHERVSVGCFLNGKYPELHEAPRSYVEFENHPEERIYLDKIPFLSNWKQGYEYKTAYEKKGINPKTNQKTISLKPGNKITMWNVDFECIIDHTAGKLFEEDWLEKKYWKRLGYMRMN